MLGKFIIFAPLLGAIVSGFFWKLIGEKAAEYTATIILFAICCLSWIVFLGLDSNEIEIIKIMRWISSGSLVADWSIRIDRLTAIMFVVITSVSALVHLYSIGYMKDDVHWTKEDVYKPRFFAYLSFFTFAMLVLVSSDNLLQLFFGWEGVGVASYLLIGFYYRKPSANAAALKAFIVNRVGDLGFAIGIMGIFLVTESIRFDDIFLSGSMLANTNIRFLWMEWNSANLLGFLLFVGAMGKSAQFFLHTWLPDAMEGPTPVSALIHAATMVTAGVFLVCRMSPILEYAPQTLTFITYVGAITAFFAASVGLVQNDIKRVIAYSTCSQLGYMFVAAGVGVYSVAMFHLFTHAFFKAMLFLGAGSVIHAMHHEQDMRKYGGLRKKIPYTFWAMMVGTLAITGVGIPLTTIGFSGFLSKDAVIESAWAGTDGGGAFWLLVVAALFTSFYSWRLVFLTFFGEARGDMRIHKDAHESPFVMLFPLGVLALGSIFSGMIWYNSFFGNHVQVNKFYGIAVHHLENNQKGNKGGNSHEGVTTNKELDQQNLDNGEHETTKDLKIYPQQSTATAGAIFMRPENHVLEEAHHSPKWVKLSPFLAMLIGFLTALWFYIWDPGMPRRLAELNRPLYLFLLNKWYFDEIYEVIFVKPSKLLGRLFWKVGDGRIIDGIVNGIAIGLVPFFTRVASRLQSGFIFTYAFAIVIGIVILVTWMTLSGGSGLDG